MVWLYIIIPAIVLFIVCIIGLALVPWLPSILILILTYVDKQNKNSYESYINDVEDET